MKKLFILLVVFTIICGVNAQVAPLIQNNFRVFRWPYNAYCPLDTSQVAINGHVGNDCGSTALARIVHYWQHPVNGDSVLNMLGWDGNQYYNDFENMDLDYSDMTFWLPINSPDSIYHQTAKLFRACVTICENIHMGYPDGIMSIPGQMSLFMKYSEQMVVAQRWDYTKSDWIALFKNELDNGRPIFIDGRLYTDPAPWEPGNWSGHAFVCDGYDSLDRFYFNYSMSPNGNDTADIDSMGVYAAYHRAIINFAPAYVGIEESLNKDLYPISVYPNPVKNNFNISINIPSNKLFQIQLRTIEGVLVYKHQEYVKSGKKIIINNSWTNGVYILSVYNDEIFFSQKVIVLE